MVLRKVAVHNLKKIDLELDLKQFIVFTGVSGSGKSSLAFDTIYMEGQRRYVDSLSTYARRQIGEFPKPEAESITGISPTIAIEQKKASKNPRSTVGTMTGIYDYLRLLYARIGVAHCPISGEPVLPQSPEQILRRIQRLPEKSKILVLAPYIKNKKGEFKEELALLLRRGYTRIRLDGKIVDLSEEIAINSEVAHDVDVIVDRLVLSREERGRLLEAVNQALDVGEGTMMLLHADTEEEQLFSTHAYSPKSGLSYSPLESHDFSFNHPTGMCPACHGLGTLLNFSIEKIIDPEKSIAEDCCKISSSYQTVRFGNIYDNLSRLYRFNIKTPWKKLSKQAQGVFLYGNEQKWTKMEFVHPTKRQSWTEYVQWEGVLSEAKRRYQEASSDAYRSRMEELMEESVCHACQGARIRPYPAATLLGGKKIHELTAFSIEKSQAFFSQLTLTEEEELIGGELIKEIRGRLSFLSEVGLQYLALERTAPTLSGGESQRVRLASQISAGLSQATYILDEPSIGLHPRDNKRLIESLRSLCDKGNTVIVVEHDEEMICAADCIVDVGPLAGEQGGEIISVGPMRSLLENERSLTGAYLSGRLTIPVPKKRRAATDKALIIEGATHHNLKNITVTIPLEVLTVITGVSGSGKSSLISDILYPALSNHFQGSKLKVGAHGAIKGMDAIDKVIAVDQTPIGRTPRSNPATYMKLFDDIRALFTELPESKAAGFKPGRFSFNVQEGSCLHCNGMGFVKIDMDFMEDEWVSCSVCQGKRFDPKTLTIRYKGKNIYEVLEMTVGEALSFFDALPVLKRKLELLQAVGLDYLKIGQSSSTLSGGEAQRIKLAKELVRPATGRTLYILDEPTTGLHFHDIKKLIDLLQQLAQRGNSVVVIEHNKDLMKVADWIIDLGPEGGEAGGRVVAAGKPEKIAKMPTATGAVLSSALKPSVVKEGKPLLKQTKSEDLIFVKGATQNNLKNLDIAIPHGKITICTGPSGCGKSSFAFETVYAEGQRRYTDTFSPFTRQFIHQMPKPKVEEITGLLAAIAIEQKGHAGNPRSTIGTMTGIYDLLRILYAHLGTPFCPETGERIISISKESVCKRLMALAPKTRVQILAPLKVKEDFNTLKEQLLREGFLRIRLNGEIYELDEEISFDKQRKNSLFLLIDRLMIDSKTEKRLYDAIDTAAAIGENTLVAVIDDKDEFFNLSFGVPSTGKSYPPITAHTFSFNTAQGMCLECLGLGFQWGANLESHPQLMRLSPLAIMTKLWKEKASDEAISLLTEIFAKRGIDEDCPLQDLPFEHLQFFLDGSEEALQLKKPPMSVRFIGMNALFAKIAKVAVGPLKEEILPWVTQNLCSACLGTRLNPLARHVRIENVSIPQLCAMPLDEAFRFVRSFDLKEHSFLQEAFEQCTSRFHFLLSIGLGYLSLDRSAPTLSGGETQRIRLASQLGAGLTGCLYVLDEPTIGLHPHNNALLNRSLQSLCAMGNTLLLVEHDPLTMQLADHFIELGPKAGKRGGHLIAQGSLEQIKTNPDSLTGAYLNGTKTISIPQKRRISTKSIEVSKAKLNNLKDLSLQFPLGILACLTGVSGSGKSTLLNNLLRPALLQSLARRQRPDTIEYKGATIRGLSQVDKLLVMDQNAIGQTIRADVSTYIDFSTLLRAFFAELPQAKIRGLQPKHFSSNHIKGMCLNCQGLGTKKISMQFLPPIRVACSVCQGFRLNPLSLEVSLKGKHFGHLLQMTVEEAIRWIPPIPKAIRILEVLLSVGLGYLSLGQEIATLSGGEAQRLRLARELSKRSRGHALYIFDEPSIGLHSDDIVKLLKVFHALVEAGHSVILIEHNLEVIGNCDYLIDLGPEAGRYGGEIVAMGTPEEIAQNTSSHTGYYLNEYFKNHSKNNENTSKKSSLIKNN